MLNTRKVNKRILAVTLASMLLLTSACSNGGNNGPSAQASNDSASPAQSAAAKPNATEGAEPDNMDPLGKYDPPIELTTGRIVEDTGWKYDEGTSIDKNKWYDLYESALGIHVKNVWVANGSEAGRNKTNVSIASGDIPDLLTVDAVQLKNLVDADMVEDLTSVFETYASELSKKLMNDDGGYGLKSATFGGKLYALPHMGSAYDSAPVLWVRTDWLEKLNLPEPQSMDDVIEIARAFVNNDPDGNNKKDTIGIGISKDVNLDGFPSMIGFFNGYHAYPSWHDKMEWVRDANGKLVYGSTLPEMKTALAKLAEMYKDGLIDKEFGVKDSAKVAESVASGKLGLYFGPMWTPFWPLSDNKNNDPSAEWKAFPIPSADDSPALAQTVFPVNTYFVLKKGYAHPEVIVKLLNLYVDIAYGPNADRTYMASPDGSISYFKYAVVRTEPVLKNIENHRAIVAALDSGDTSKLNSEQKSSYDMILKWRNDKDQSGWGQDRIFGHVSSFAVIDGYVKNNLTQPAQFFGPATPTMTERMSTLLKMEQETMTKIILGTSDIDEFDKFVSEWYKLGGEQITKEVNDWAASK